MMATVVLVVVVMMVAVLVRHVLRRLGRGRCLGERRGGKGGKQCCDEQGLEGGGHGGDFPLSDGFVWCSESLERSRLRPGLCLKRPGRCVRRPT